MERKLKTRIRYLLLFFIFGLVLSGITAFPIETELHFFSRIQLPSDLQNWISKVHNSVSFINQNYPFLSYGTDWLAFAHLVIAVVFIGPLRDPVKNIWVIQFGMIACFMVFPLAFIAGEIREIPFYWRVIDCFFGVIALVPLFICYKSILKLEKLQSQPKLGTPI